MLLEKTQSAFERGKELMAQNMTTEALSFLESAVEDNPEVTEVRRTFCCAFFIDGP